FAFDRACRDIDQLHTAIRDDDEPAPHDTVGHKQVSTTFRISPRVVVATHHNKGSSADSEHHDDGYDRGQHRTRNSQRDGGEHRDNNTNHTEHDAAHRAQPDRDAHPIHYRRGECFLHAVYSSAAHIGLMAAIIGLPWYAATVFKEKGSTDQRKRRDDAESARAAVTVDSGIAQLGQGVD